MLNNVEQNISHAEKLKLLREKKVLILLMQTLHSRQYKGVVAVQ